MAENKEITPPDRKFFKGRSSFTYLLLIILLILPACISVFCRSYFREPVSDDLLYQHVLDAHPLGDNDYSEVVNGWSDAIKSQSIQYFNHGGRVLIHVMIQMFAGPWGWTAYAVFLSFLFLAVVAVFIKYTIPYYSRSNPLIWLLVIITFLYLFQNFSNLWYSIVGGWNYLFPMLPVLISLLAVKHLEKSRVSSNIISYIFLALLGIITGWCQECYSIPLAGGIFFYILSKRWKVKSSIWIFTAFLWLGTAILVFAPGNFVRLGQKAGILASLMTGVKYLCGTYLFWLALIGGVLLRLKSKIQFKEYFQSNILVFFALSIGVIFGLCINTLPQSFNGVSFYSAILLFRLFYYVPKKITENKALVVSASLIGIVLISLHQYRIVTATRLLQNRHHAFVQQYLATPSGVMLREHVELPFDVKPFIRSWFDSSTDWWNYHTLNAHYWNGTRPIYVLNDVDYQIYTSGLEASSSPAPNMQGGVRGDGYLWYVDSIAPVTGDTIIIYRKPFIHSPLKLWVLNMIGKKVDDKKENVKELIVDSTFNIIRGNGVSGFEAGGNNIDSIVIRRGN